MKLQGSFEFLYCWWQLWWW